MTEEKYPWEFESPLCREIGGDLFYSGDEDDPEFVDNNFVNTQLAKKICQGCDHKIDCLNWGLKHEAYGVWGGLSPRDLTLLRAKKKITLSSINLFKYQRS